MFAEAPKPSETNLNWPAQLRQAIHATADGRIDRLEVARLVAESGRSLDELLQAMVGPAQSFARPTISQFPVGAAALGRSGAIYLGMNIEFAGCPLNHAVHAEQAAVVAAMSHKERRIDKLAVSASPCGSCRQFLLELVDGKDLTLLVGDSDPWTLNDYLPRSFGPQELTNRAGLLSAQRHSLQIEGLESLAPESSRGKSRQMLNRSSSSVRAALAGAVASYAPYTQAFGGAAVVVGDAMIFSGSYIENVAFAPSLSPLQAALVSLAFSGHSFRDIVHVDIAQQVNAAVDHVPLAQLILSRIAPAASLNQVTVGTNTT